MIDFIIKSGISMTALLAIYHLFLEKEKMHEFNRLYLLLSLVFSLALPFITITIYTEAMVSVPASLSGNSQAIANMNPALIKTPHANYVPDILWGLYILITVVMLLRFVKNILYFTKQISSGIIESYKSSKLVLIDADILPHIFLNYIFLNRKSYDDRDIEEEIYTHELVHVTQKHTLDILFIETLKVFFWFNPLLYFYKKAIQLNHEFLADESVIATTRNVISYQQLLLQKSFPATYNHLASSLNFSITKKRFIMMTKATTRSRALILKFASLPIIAVLVLFFCTEIIAQTKIIGSRKKPASISHNQTGDQRRDAYYKGVWVSIDDQVLNLKIEKIYDELSEAEKDRYLFYAPEPYTIKHPTKKEFESFKNKKGYALQIDGKDVDNAILNKYKPEDFAYYSGYTMAREALTKEHPQIFHYLLYTRAYYEKNLKGTNTVYPGKVFEMTVIKEIVNDEPIKRHSKARINKSNK